MNRNRTLWALAVLNIALAIAFIWRMTPDNTAYGQVHRPGDYIMIPANISGGSNQVVYIIDTANGWLAAGMYDENGKSVIKAMPAMDLNRVFSSGGGVVPGAGVKPR